MSYGQSSRRAARDGAFVAGLALACWATTGSAAAGSGNFQTLYTFCSQKNCADGAFPNGVTSDASGNIYGTTQEGGNLNGGGTAYGLTPNGSGGYNFAVLYAFCAFHNCPDGQTPYAPPIVDTAGNLYGTTQGGGANGGGTVYELTQSGGVWTEKVLYSFCSLANCSDGSRPSASLTYAGASSGVPYDGASPLYGSATQGGTGEGGVVFAIQPSGGAWSEQTLYSFVSPSAPAGLTLDPSGNLFGALSDGGSKVPYAGSIFELSPGGGGWTERSVYDFCRTKTCKSGASPWGAPYVDGGGHLWGTTIAGGDLGCISQPQTGCGTLFMLTPGEAGYQETTVHRFCTTKTCADGARPFGPLQPDSQGNLFGTALSGRGNSGSLFELSGSTFNVLHTFCKGRCKDGDQPMLNLVVTAAGSVIGTTFSGAYPGNEQGSVYEVTP